jgi:hypothetical protein
MLRIRSGPCGLESPRSTRPVRKSTRALTPGGGDQILGADRRPGHAGDALPHLAGGDFDSTLIVEQPKALHSPRQPYEIIPNWRNELQFGPPSPPAYLLSGGDKVDRKGGTEAHHRAALQQFGSAALGGKTRSVGVRVDSSKCVLGSLPRAARRDAARDCAPGPRPCSWPWRPSGASGEPSGASGEPW